MKCLIVNTLYPPAIVGGAEKSVALLAEGLVNAGHEVYALALHGGNETIHEDIGGVRIIRVPIDNIYWPFGEKRERSVASRAAWHLIDIWNNRAAQRIERIIGTIRPDIVHTNSIRGLSVSVWKAAADAGVPVAHTLRDYSLACGRGGMYRRGHNCESHCFECKMLTFIKRRASKKVDVVISNSEFVLKRHQRLGFFEGVESRVIFNIGRSVMPARACAPENVIFFGYIGRLEPMKGIEVVLEATRKIEAANWQMVIAGSGSDQYVNDLRRRYPDRRIEWLGFVTEEQFYSKIDVCLVPSLWEEPLPRALIECFSFGKAAIYSDSGGNKEIGVFGKQVRQYPASDVDALTDLLNAAVNNPSEWKNGGFASQEAKERVAEKTVVAEYVDGFSSAIRNRA